LATPPAQSWADRLKHPAVVVPAIAVLAFGVWFVAIRKTGGSSSNSTPTLANQVVTVTRGPMGTTVSAQGTVAAAQTDNLSFGSAGTVTAVNVTAGQAVTAGQVLATVNSAQLQSAVASAQSTVASAQASLADDEASGASSEQVTADQTSVTSANDALAAAQTALSGASLVSTFNGTVSQVNVTVGEQLSGSGSGGTSSTGTGSGSGQSTASVGSSTSSNSARGILSALSSGSSSSSSSSNPQIQVVSKGTYTVQLPLSSSDIGSVKVGQPVSLTVTTASGGGLGGLGGGGAFARLFGGGGGAAAFGGGGNGGTNRSTGTNGRGTTGRAGGATAQGKVTSVSKVATASSGVATFPVTVTFTDPSNNIFVGSTVTGAITTNTRQNVLQVPVRAVTNTNGTSTVEVSKNGSANGPTETRTVKTGLTANGMIEITSGLRQGDKVVVSFPNLRNLTLPTGNGQTRGGNGTGGFGGFGGFGGGGGGGTGGGQTP
jgi:multidrug efflux pump subunit AcrA (membrane-fusion protein)